VVAAAALAAEIIIVVVSVAVVSLAQLVSCIYSHSFIAIGLY
jgi:hypothetical protein